jgi:protease YdgD
VAPPLMRHDCTGTRGSSGAPLLVRTPAGFAILGVAVAAAREGAGGLAVRPRLAD